MKKLTDQHANYKTLVFDDVVNLVTFLYYRIFTPLTLIAAIDRIHFDEAELWSRLNEALEKGKIKVASSAQYGALFKMSWVCDEILKRLDKLVTDGVKSGFGGGGIGAARALGGGGRGSEMKHIDEESVARMDFKGVAMFCVGETVLVRGYDLQRRMTKKFSQLMADCVGYVFEEMR